MRQADVDRVAVGDSVPHPADPAGAPSMPIGEVSERGKVGVVGKGDLAEALQAVIVILYCRVTRVVSVTLVKVYRRFGNVVDALVGERRASTEAAVASKVRSGHAAVANAESV